MLLSGALLLGPLFKATHVQAGLLLGQMIVAITLAVRGDAMDVAERVIGWALLFVGPTLATVAGSAIIAATLIRGGWLPRGGDLGQRAGRRGIGRHRDSAVDWRWSL